MSKHVIVGMSGGVDSSLTAALLVEQGYRVTGVYMKNWSQDLPGLKCPWAEDLADAKRVAVQLGIDFEVYDFEAEYKDKVVEYMIDEYSIGRTPNPDIMCNQEVKFKLFLDAALKNGADYIATGHYAKVVGGSWNTVDGKRQFQEITHRLPSTTAYLKIALDTNKDQTYFLYRIQGEALKKTLFPLGNYTKPEVRKMAEERGLITAGKKDSQGICFVGQIGIREFLGQYIDAKPGDIIEKESGKLLGKHDGALFYTLGQRHKLNIGGGLPYYVVAKDMPKNQVIVSRDINDDSMWLNKINLSSLHWINEAPTDHEIQIRVRHRAPLVTAQLDGSVLHLPSAQRAVTPGQSVVIYQGDLCLGGGIVVE